jgi:mannosyltransferase
MNYHISRKNAFGVLACLMAFVTILSLFIFSRQSLRLDEAQSLWQTSHNAQKILNIIAQDVHVPLYHFILHYWQVFIGNTVFWGRMLSLVFFLASIPAMYALGRRITTTNVSLFATTLYAISPFMNWYGNEIRMYSLLTLLTILSQYFFIGIYRRHDSDSWIGYFLVSLFGIFTHYFFFFILVVQLIFYFMYRTLFQRNALKRFVLVAVLLFIAFSPWLIYVRHLGTISNEAPLLIPPTSVTIFNTLSQFLFGFQNDHLNTILVSLWPITVLLGFLALRKNKWISPDVIYILLSILIPIAAAFIVSVTVLPLFVSRYLILTIPSMYLFISWIFSTYPEALGKMLRAILIFAMVGGIIVEAVSPSTPVKENYREATEYLESHASYSDIIILSAPFTVYPVEYYYKGPAEIATLPKWDRLKTGPIPPFDINKLPAEVDSLKGSHVNAWVLLSYEQGKNNEQIQYYFDTNFEKIDLDPNSDKKELTFSDGLTLHEYRLRYDIPSFNSNQATSTPSR